MGGPVRRPRGGFGARGARDLYLSVAAPPASIEQADVLTAERRLLCPDIVYAYPELNGDTYPEKLPERRDRCF
ncbi:hypothetical protein [Streptomyces sp. NPDC001970]